MYTCIHGNLPTHAARMQIAAECGFCCRCSDNTLGDYGRPKRVPTIALAWILPDPDGIRSTGYGRKFACNCNIAQAGDTASGLFTFYHSHLYLRAHSDVQARSTPNAKAT